MSTTIESRLREVDYRPSGFDYLRIGLALSVIFVHSFLQDVQHAYILNFFGIYVVQIVPMFFALSGFLVASSLERCKSLVSFVGLRVFRIFPALVVEVFVSALIIGPIFTTLPLKDYFGNHTFHVYFWNLIGHIHYYLPGVFEDHKISQVNGQLWTVPWELMCYISISIIAIIGAYRYKLFFTCVLVFAYLFEAFRYAADAKPLEVATGEICLLSFLCGLWLYRHRDSIALSKPLFALSAAALLVVYLVPGAIRFTALPTAYATVCIGLTNPVRSRILATGDYSYGIYLYGYAVQQSIFAISPAFNDWRLALLACAPATIALAVVSWHFIERPFLSKKAVVGKVEAWFLNSPIFGRSALPKYALAVGNMGGARQVSVAETKG
jgi:peptidoglycan/LPS O-acetylase OafA/YrhL